MRAACPEKGPHPLPSPKGRGAFYPLFERARRAIYENSPFVRRWVNARRHRREIKRQLALLRAHGHLFSLQHRERWWGDIWTLNSKAHPTSPSLPAFAISYDFDAWTWRVEYLNHTLQTDKPPLWEALDFYGYLLALNPAEGDVVLDVGASDGFISSLFSRHVGERGRVLAVEPDPEFQKAIGRTISRNRLTNCGIAPWAIGPDTRMVTFAPNRHAGKVVGERCAAGETPDERNLIEVPQRSLSDCVAELFRCHPNARVLLKFDVEGYEVELVDSIIEVVAGNPRAVAGIASYHLVNERRTHEIIHEAVRSVDAVACATIYPLHLTTLMVSRSNRSELERLQTLENAVSGPADGLRKTG